MIHKQSLVLLLFKVSENLLRSRQTMEKIYLNFTVSLAKRHSFHIHLHTYIMFKAKFASQHKLQLTHTV
ncbi:CLUMA_CG002864, isoform A [Clunio marinus]|uniref:CLUMA_CG002864, isoform A n=1 Tax=Clunio marinus TaxID=568069 RepID=A0A1J1HKZ6_9DIPT|nr:CLUMA_CG002864, isoform A [Clunio marinus]